MCIRTNQEKLEAAKEDITVYKLIDVNPGVFALKNYDLSRCMLFEQPEKYHYNSFYQFALIDKNCVENKQPFIAKGYARSTELSLGARYKYSYGKGLIHTFENEDDALKSMEPNDFDAFAILYKCTIPKGTEYIKGVEDDGFPSYAAKKIIFEEPVHFGEVAKEWHEMKQKKKTTKPERKDDKHPAKRKYK